MFLKSYSKISPKVVSLVFGVLLLCFALGFWVLAWEEPGAPPPGDNVPAPLNVGTDAQTKTGDLTFPAFYDLDPDYYVDPAGGAGGISAALSGKVGIGTTTPGIFKLYVDGKIRASSTEDTDSDDTVATKGYVDAASGGGGGEPVFEWGVIEPDGYVAIAGTWMIGHYTGHWENAHITNTPDEAQNDAISLGYFYVPETANYTAYAKHRQATDHGRIHLLLNNVDKGYVECYNTESLFNIFSTVALGELTKGQYVLVVKISDKHGGSTGYRVDVNSIMIAKD